MNSGMLGLPRKLVVWNTDIPFFTQAAPVTATYGAFNIGDAPFDGVSSGKFSGSSSNLIAINSTQTSGDLINIATSGNTKFELTSSGRLFIYSQPNASSNVAILNVGATGSLFNGVSNGAFQGDATTGGGTYLAIDASNTFVGNILDLQVAASSGVNTNANRVHLLTYQGVAYYPKAPQSVATFGLLNLGAGPFDGTTSGFFTGNSAGNHLAINAASGFTGDLARFQLAGVSKWRVDSTGTVVQSGPITATSSFFSGTPGSGNTANAFVQIGTGFAGGGAPQFVGSSSGTYLGINNQAGTFVGNFEDFQSAGVSKWKVDSSGNATSAGQFNDGTGVGTAARLDSYKRYS